MLPCSSCRRSNLTVPVLVDDGLTKILWENLLAVDAVVKEDDVFLVHDVSAASDTSVRVPSVEAEFCSAVLKVTIVPLPPRLVFFT